MSIQTEITRIETAKSDLAAWLTSKGVTVPSGSKIDTLVSLLSSVPGGDGEEYDMYAGRSADENMQTGDLWVDTSDESGGGLPDVIRAGDTPVLSSSALVDTISSTSVSATDISVTVPKAGTYRFKCSAARTSTSGTFTVQLYRGNSAISGATATWSSREGTLSKDVECSANDTITVRARSGSTNNYTIVGQLVACIDWDIWG